MRTWRGWFVVVLVVSLLAHPAWGQTSPSEHVDALFAKYNRKDSPGCVVMLLRDGKPAHEKAYGMANLELGVPLSLGSVFLLASVSKQFLIFCIMLLAQRGQLSLDDDIHKHVPEVPEFGTKITLRHLVHHTSGLREDLTLFNLAGWRSEDAITQADFLRLVKNQKEMNFAPGEQYLYCNTGYHLLAMVVERVSKQPFAEFARENIFTPLGMKHTLIRDDHRLVVPNLAGSYSPGKDGKFLLRNVAHGPPGASNVFSTAGDLALWDQNFYDAKAGGAKVIALLHEKGKLSSGKEIPYAGGINVSQYRGLRTVAHAGSHGGFRTYLLRFPEERFSVIFLSNLSTFNSQLMSLKVADIFLGDRLKPRAPRPPEIKVDAETLKNYAGEYRAGGVVVEVYQKSEQLFLRGLETKRLIPVAVDRFIETEDDHEYAFVKSKDGFTLEMTIFGQKASAPRLKPIKLPSEKLSSYTGDFYSDELEVMYKLSMRDGQLVLQYSKGETALEPQASGEFIARPKEGFFTWMTLRFTTKEGKTAGFLLSTERVRNLRFQRARIEAVP